MKCLGETHDTLNSLIGSTLFPFSQVAYLPTCTFAIVLQSPRALFFTTSTAILPILWRPYSPARSQPSHIILRAQVE